MQQDLRRGCIRAFGLRRFLRFRLLLLLQCIVIRRDGRADEFLPRGCGHGMENVAVFDRSVRRRVGRLRHGNEQPAVILVNLDAMHREPARQIHAQDCPQFPVRLVHQAVDPRLQGIAHFRCDCGFSHRSLHRLRNLLLLLRRLHPNACFLFLFHCSHLPS